MEPESPKSDHTLVTILTSNNTVELAFIGDLFLGGNIISYSEINETSMLVPFTEVLPVTKKADILVVNLEGPIFTGSNKREDVTAILSNHPSVIGYLSQHDNCVVNMANNHIMDYGEEGLQNTIALLKEHNIPYVGAGRNYAEANEELIINTKNKKIAFLAYTSDEKHIRSIIAGHDTPGCATYLDLEQASNKIQSIKQKVDIVCVSLHWGHEYYQYPSPDQVRIAHVLADAGADYIIGHHPHVIQGTELYNNALIAYSLGNFFFPEFRMQNGRIRLFRKLEKEFMIILSTHNDNGQVDCTIKGGNIENDNRLYLYKKEKEAEFKKNMAILSDNITKGIDEYSLFWEAYSKNRKKQLNREDIHLALRKLSRMQLNDIVKEIKWSDVKRNIGRLSKSIKEHS